MGAMNKSVVLGSLVVFLVSFSFIPQVSAVSCGDTITQDTTLTGDLNCNTDYGLIIGADGITLDCNGYSITGSSGSYGYGIYADGRNGFSVKNCNVDGFQFSLYIRNSDSNIIESNIFNTFVALSDGQYPSDYNVLKNNNIRGRTWVYGSFNTFDRNTFNVDPGLSNEVINLQGPNNTFINNVLSGLNQGRGIGNADNAIGNNFTNNIISNYYEGMLLGGAFGGEGAQENIVSNNSFINNFEAIEIDGGDLNMIYGNVIASVGGSYPQSQSMPSRPYIDKVGNIVTQQEGWGFILGSSNFNIIWNNSIYNQNNYFEINSNFYCYQGEGNEYNFNITPDCEGDCIIPNCTVDLDNPPGGGGSSLLEFGNRRNLLTWSGWREFNYGDAYNGSLIASTPGTGQDRTGWEVHTKPSQYEIKVWKFDHPYTYMMGTNVHYYVKHANGVNLFTIDWSDSGDKWISLGNFTFDDIGGLQGVMINDNADGYVIADAIKLISNGPPVYEEGMSNLAHDSGLTATMYTWSGMSASHIG